MEIAIAKICTEAVLELFLFYNKLLHRDFTSIEVDTELNQQQKSLSILVVVVAEKKCS